MNLQIFLAITGIAALAGCNPSASSLVSVTAGGSQANVTRTISVARGATARLNFVTAVNENCTVISGNFARMSRSPAHGSLNIVNASEYPNFAKPNPRAQCNTQKVSGQIVSYTANSSYTGPDSLAYDRFLHTGAVIHYEVSINIL